MNMNDDVKPLATYRDSLAQWKRTIYLFPDRVRVLGRTWRVESDTTVLLKILSPERNLVHYRSSAFVAGAGMFVAFAMLSVVIIAGMLETNWMWTLAVIPPALALVGLGVAITTVRKITWVVFNTQTGLPGLSIADAGRDRHRFDAFVERVTEAIHNAQSPATTEQEEKNGD